MRRLVLLVLIAVLALGAGITSATSVDELSDIARHYPADTVAFGTVRTDSGYIETLDGVFDAALQYLPADQVPPITLNDALNLAVSELGFGSFDEAIRPWLGDQIAAGLWLPEEITEEFIDDGEADFLLTFDVVDADLAQSFISAFVTEFAGADAAIPTEDGDLLVWEANSATWFALSDDTMFIASKRDNLMVAVDSPLSDNAMFSDTLAQLPEDEYNILGYLDAGRISQFSNELNARTLAQFGDDATLSFLESDLFMAASNVSSVVAVGATILDGNSFTIDLAAIGDFDALADFGFVTFIPEPIDLSFANRIPASSPAVYLSSQPGQASQAFYDTFRLFGDYVKANGGWTELLDPTGELFVNELVEQDPMVAEAALNVINAIDPAWFLGFINLPFAGLTGMSLERDIFPVINSDGAVYLNVRSVDDFPILPVLPDLGILYGTTDDAGAIEIVENINFALDAYDIPNSPESYGDGQAAVVTTASLGFPYEDLDIMLGASGDGVLAIGNRAAVAAALETSGGLADDPIFQAASEHFLDGSYSVLYLASEPLYMIVDDLIDAGFIPMFPEVGDIYRGASIVDSASITTAVPMEDVSQIRFVLTLSDAPRELGAGDQASR